MVYVSSLSLWSKIIIHPTRKVQIALLFAKKVIIPAKYLDFADLFLKEPPHILLEQIRVNKHAIKLKQSKQPPYWPIYSLGLIKFKTFKTYIKTKLANGFIRALKLLVSAPILFICKFNSSVCLYVNYWELNNFTIKNRYLLLLIGESLNWLA